MPVQRRAFASLGAHISDREACAPVTLGFSAAFSVTPMPTMLMMSRSYRNALVQERHVQRLHVPHARHALARRAVVNHIVKHFQTKVEPNGFKAQVVVFDRECCVLYKAVMDELIGPEASAIVMTGAQGDPPEWKQHVRDKDAEEKLLDRFRDPADPLKFVIVTSKLLTGFDAPILQVMYLDKPMKDHNLLQAICRTNRTFGQEKTHGLIVDYIGIFDDVARALDFDEKAVQQVVSNIDELRKALPVQVQKCLAFFPGVDRSVGGYEGLMAAQQCLPNNEVRDKFAAEYSVLGTIWEALSPDPVLSPYETGLPLADAGL